MQNLTNHEELLEKTRQAFRGVRRSLMEGAAYLYQVDQQNAWELHYSSLGEFVEAECQMSRSQASKLLQTYKFFVVDNKVSQAKLEDIDHDKLYTALKLEGSAEKKLAMAQTLSRSEMRQETKDPEDKCLHEQTFTCCVACHKRV